MPSVTLLTASHGLGKTVKGGYLPFLRSAPAQCRYETLLQLLAQDLQDVAAEFRKFIQEKNAVVRQRHFDRQQCRPMPLFVKNVPHMTMHGHERASLLAREPHDLFYKTGTDQVRSGDWVTGEPGLGSRRARRCSH